MHSRLIILIILFVQLAYANDNVNPSLPKSVHLVYPKAKEVAKTWSYPSFKAKGNVTIQDPFYWLEKGLNDSDFQQFINQQSILTTSYMQNCQNSSEISQSIRNAFDFNMYSFLCLVENEKIKEPFYIYRLRLVQDNQPTWYLSSKEEMQKARKNNLEIPPGKKFLNESLLGFNGSATIQDFTISPDGKTFAYLVSGADFDFANWYFRSFDSPLVQAKTTPDGGEGRLADLIPDIGGNADFTVDGEGFLYIQQVYDATETDPEIGSRIRYHEMGTPYENDITIIHPDFRGESGTYVLWSVKQSSDGLRMIVYGSINAADDKRVCYATLLKGQTFSDKMKWISVSPSFDFFIGVLDVIDDYLYVRTDKDAIDFKIAKTKLDFSKAKQVQSLSELNDELGFIDVIPTQPSYPCNSAYPFSINYVLLFYTNKGRNDVFVYNLKTGQMVKRLLENEKSNPQEAYGGFRTTNTFTISLEDLTSPKVLYEITLERSTITESLITRQNVKGMNSDEFTNERLSAISKDGTPIPYEIVYRKGTPKDGSRPCWLHAYGINGDIEVDFYVLSYFSWLASYGGFFIWASPRGGGDEGEKWHLAATNHTKQRTFDDIIAIGEDLMNRKICAPGKLIGEGSSGGGMAQLVVANQAPIGLFGAILAPRTVSDVFLLERSDIGAFQVDELGSIYDPVDFDYILDYSPLQNIAKDKPYPAILVVPGAEDSRVGIAQSSKFIAQIQKLNPNNSMPLLMYLALKTGHSESFNTDQYVIEATQHHCFLQIALNLTRYQ